MGVFREKTSKDFTLDSVKALSYAPNTSSIVVTQVLLFQSKVLSSNGSFFQVQNQLEILFCLQAPPFLVKGEKDRYVK